jgi:ribosome-associated protein
MSPRSRTPEETSEVEAESTHRRSHREKKQERKALEALAQRLASLRPHELDALGLDEDLRAALDELGSLSGSARNRQAKLVHGLLRRGDLEAIEQSLDRGMGSSYAPGRADEAGVSEQWLARLLAEGDPAIQALVETQPEADRRQLRQLVRTASRTPESAATRRARRALRALIDELVG